MFMNFLVHRSLLAPFVIDEMCIKLFTFYFLPLGVSSLLNVYMDFCMTLTLVHVCSSTVVYGVIDFNFELSFFS